MSASGVCQAKSARSDPAASKILYCLFCPESFVRVRTRAGGCVAPGSQQQEFEKSTGMRDPGGSLHAEWQDSERGSGVGTGDILRVFRRIPMGRLQVLRFTMGDMQIEVSVTILDSSSGRPGRWFVRHVHDRFSARSVRGSVDRSLCEACTSCAVGARRSLWF